MLKRQCVSSASNALRASLGIRFTHTQVTTRSSALNTVVEDAKMFQMVISTPQNSQRAAVVKITRQNEENKLNGSALKRCLKQTIGEEESFIAITAIPIFKG
ncbi:hypothetical protein RKI04_11205 [Citrobacter amalonaticus]|uniref:hypothetical protein n=1 Tax=Citrobacter amalonaticus TaxID=35703 RepID=UPI0028798E4E|nr:hypothetical protein [Citrobacter amalonaticus]MDS4036822.1 hypothetical protein [Citrobacter amalonaticus]